MKKLFFRFAWLFFSIISTNSPSISGQKLDHDPPPQRTPDQQRITFFMQDVLGKTSPSPGQVSGSRFEFPFPKPRGFFPPLGGIPMFEPPHTNPPVVAGIVGQSGQPIAQLPFSKTMQVPEFGTITAIDEVLREGSMVGSPLAGKVRGVYVKSSKDGGTYMMAMTATFTTGGKSDDALEFFGVHQAGVPESHITIVGGTGKYHRANGYATVKTVRDTQAEMRGIYKNLLVTVYLI